MIDSLVYTSHTHTSIDYSINSPLYNLVVIRCFVSSFCEMSPTKIRFRGGQKRDIMVLLLKKKKKKGLSATQMSLEEDSFGMPGCGTSEWINVARSYCWQKASRNKVYG